MGRVSSVQVKPLFPSPWPLPFALAVAAAAAAPAVHAHQRGGDDRDEQRAPSSNGGVHEAALKLEPVVIWRALITGAVLGVGGDGDATGRSKVEAKRGQQRLADHGGSHLVPAPARRRQPNNIPHRHALDRVSTNVASQRVIKDIGNGNCRGWHVGDGGNHRHKRWLQRNHLLARQPGNKQRRCKIAFHNQARARGVKGTRCPTHRCRCHCRLRC